MPKKYPRLKFLLQFEDGQYFAKEGFKTPNKEDAFILEIRKYPESDIRYHSITTNTGSHFIRALHIVLARLNGKPIVNKIGHPDSLMEVAKKYPGKLTGMVLIPINE